MISHENQAKDIDFHPSCMRPRFMAVSYEMQATDIDYHLSMYEAMLHGGVG
jgi:hypothetical protein